MKEYDKAVLKLGQESADRYMKMKAELVAMGNAEDDEKFEEWLSQREFTPYLRGIDLTEPLISRMMTGQAVQGYILIPVDEKYIAKLQTGNSFDVFRAEDFTDVENPPYGHHVFRPGNMGYKPGLLVSRYLLKHRDEPMGKDFNINGSITPIKKPQAVNRFSTYDLAYTFKKSKVWQFIRDQQIFAINLPDGQIGYCIIMGQGGEHMALSLHIGAEGFSSYRRLIEMGQSSTSYIDLLQQDCIQCSIEKRDQFSSEELAELRSYCKERGIPFRAPFPQFARYKRYSLPWPVAEDSDWDAIHAALTIVVKIIDMIGTWQPASLVPHMIFADTEGEYYLDGTKGPVSIPLYSIENNTLKAEPIPLPPYTDGRFSPPTSINEVALHKLMKLKKSGVLQCEIIRGPEPVNGEPPYLPALLMGAKQEDGLVLPPTMPNGLVYEPNEMVDGFLRSLVSAKLYPEAIMVRTEETETVLEPFCEKARIRLIHSDELEELDEAIDAMTEHMSESGDNQVGDVMEALKQMSIDEIRMLPDFILGQMLEMGDALPRLIIDKIRETLEP